MLTSAFLHFYSAFLRCNVRHFYYAINNYTNIGVRFFWYCGIESCWCSDIHTILGIILFF